jgi:5-methyltetrahydrofolate--homocysteine methyltransferase
VKANATAIGLSALLVSTSKQMPLIVNEMQRRGHKIPILIGGAAINRRFGRRILFTEDGEAYEPGVFYCKDAFEGLDTMDALIDPNRKPAMLEQLRKDADMEMEPRFADSRPPQDRRHAFEHRPCTDCPACQTRSAYRQRYAA